MKVYIKTDSNNYITSIASEIFIMDLAGWIQLDDGDSADDKYSHADNYYLTKGLIDTEGKYNYKYENREVIELTPEEKKTQVIPQPKPTQSIKELVKQNSEDITAINEAIATLAEIIGGE